MRDGNAPPLHGAPAGQRQRGHEALRLARKLAHPFTLASALSWTALLAQCRRDTQEVWQRAEELIALATAHGFVHRRANGMVLHGWALSVQGQRAEALTQLHQGMTFYRATWAEQFPLHQLAILAEAYGNLGHADEGLRLLAALWATEHTQGERYYEAELYRLTGELQLAQTGQGPSAEGQPHTCAEVEAYFSQALAMAHGQQAKWLELRAAMSLSRLWQRQGKQAAARQLLAEVYDWFAEGFDTANLWEARVLLAELS